jgi:hypothetical protein
MERINGTCNPFMRCDPCPDEFAPIFKSVGKAGLCSVVAHHHDEGFFTKPKRIKLVRHCPMSLSM